MLCYDLSLGGEPICFELTQYMEMKRKVGSNRCEVHCLHVGSKISTPSSVMRLIDRAHNIQNITESSMTVVVLDIMLYCLHEQC